jgi:predicted nuclease of predicted toxin-antitoxin system
VKLLIDADLSDRIIPRILDLYPDSTHVKTVGLGAADDGIIWNFARDNNFTLVSRDSDFHQRSLVFGHPPKFVFVKIGNAPTSRVVDLLRASHPAIEAFHADPGASILVLS